MAAEGLYPASDEGHTPEKDNNLIVSDTKGGAAAVEMEKSGSVDENGGPHEMHGEHVPPYSRELQGDNGPARHELPARKSTRRRRGSV